MFERAGAALAVIMPPRIFWYFPRKHEIQAKEPCFFNDSLDESCRYDR